MAISPVSSVSFNNYNNVTFAGKENKENRHSSHTTSPVKAVPLAVLLAMSPMVNVDAQNSNFRVIDKKIYSGVLRDELVKNMDLRVEFLDSDGNASTIENVNFSSDRTVNRMMNNEPLGRYDIYGGVKSLTDYTFNVIGDDGNSAGKIGYSQLILSDGHEISLGNVVDDMRKFSSSSKNNAFDVKKINVNLIPFKDGGIKTKINGATNFDTSWVQKTRNRYYDFGKKILMGELQTSQGNYKISFYSKDGNDNNFETVVMERDDGLRFKLDGITQLDLMFATADGNRDEKISLGMINVSWPEVGQHSIFDDELFNEIFKLAQDKKFNKAFSASIINKKVTVTQNGILTTYKQEKKQIL